MASNTKSVKDVKLLVAHKKAVESESAWNKFEYPAFKGADGIYFIDDTESYNETASKIGTVCKKSVTRMYYVDSDNDEVPIDSEVEYKEALKLIGERTQKGKFTSMKIESNFAKCGKKRDKGKQPKMSSEKKTSSSKISKSAPKKNPPHTTPLWELFKDEGRADLKVDTAKQKTDLSKIWLEKHLDQLKLELITNVEAVLEPYVKQQNKIIEMIAALQLEDRLVSPRHLKNQSEADHNYSSPSTSKTAHDKKTPERKSRNVSESGDLISQILENVSLEDHCDVGSVKEPSAHCSYAGEKCDEICTNYYCCVENTDCDEENLSIFSGEITVTESESDGDVDDFVDVPLPACFNVVSAHKGTISKKSAQEKSVMDFNKKKKGEKLSKTCDFFKNQRQRDYQLKSNKDLSSFSSKKFKLEVGPIKKSNLKKELDLLARTGVKNEECNQDEEVYANIVRENTQDFHGFHDLIEDAGENAASDALISLPSEVFQEKSAEQSGQPCIGEGQLQRNEALSLTLEGNPKLLLAEGASHPLGPVQQYNTPAGAHNPVQHAPVLPKQALQQRQQEAWKFRAPALVQSSNGHFVAAGNVFLSTPQIKPVLSPPESPTSKVQNNAVKRNSLIPASLVTQHQQIVTAAQRAAHQAQLRQQQQIRHIESTSCASGSQDVKSAVSNHNQQTIEGHCGHNQPAPCQIQETKLWTEVEAVDIELRKWVKMCQELLEQTPSSSLENLKNTETMASKTQQDLEKVYVKFRKEVETVSRQINAQEVEKKQQIAAGQQHPWTEDPILILPERIMEVISATLNSTFNILANIGKLGVLSRCSSEETAESNPPPVVEKPQPQVASSNQQKPQPQVSPAVAPLTPARMGHASQNIACGYYSYIPAVPTGLQNAPMTSSTVETVSSQDSPASYQIRPLTAAPTFGSNYPLIWAQNIPSYSPVQSQAQQQQMQHQLLPQLQNQIQPQVPVQQQIQQQIHQRIQQQIKQRMLQRQLQQPLQPQLLIQHQLQAPLLQQVMTQDDTRFEAAYNGIPIHEYPLSASDTLISNNAGMPVFYPPPRSGSGGLGPKTYGTLKN